MMILFAKVEYWTQALLHKEVLSDPFVALEFQLRKLGKLQGAEYRCHGSLFVLTWNLDHSRSGLQLR